MNADKIPQPAETELMRVSKKIGIHDQMISQALSLYNEEEIVHAILNDRIDQLLQERDRKLRKISAEELKSIQGEIAGLELAKGAINRK